MNDTVWVLRRFREEADWTDTTDMEVFDDIVAASDRLRTWRDMDDHDDRFYHDLREVEVQS